MAELKFQKELRTSIENEDGWAETLSHRFKHGLPDLMWKLPDSQVVFAECKEVHASSKRNKPTIKIESTALQREYLTTLRNLGIPVAILVKVIVDKKVHKVYTIKDIEAREFNMHDAALVLKSTEAKIWDVKLITKLIEGKPI